MSFRSRNKKKKRTLAGRHEKSVKAPKQRGRYPSIIRKDKLPEGVEVWRCGEGEHLIDIIPWEAGPDMPLDQHSNVVTNEGDLDYFLNIWVHQNIGSMKQPYVCPYQNFGEDCPICEYLSERRLPKDEWDALRPKERTIYLIWSHDTREEEKKGIQIWEVASFFMQQKLDKIAKLPRGGGVIDFSNYDTGKSISFEREGKGGSNTAYDGHAFIEREMEIPDKILDQTFSLDQVVEMRPSYDEIAKAFKGQIERKQKEEDAGKTYDESSGEGDLPNYDDDDDLKKKKTGTRKRKRKPASSTTSTKRKRTASSSGKRKRTRTRR